MTAPAADGTPAGLAGRRPGTVFLDRDGTLNVKAAEGDYIRTPDDLILLPGAARAVAALNRAGVRTVLVTNQRWLSGPDRPRLGYRAVHARLQRLLAGEGARLDAAYHCPHPAGTCGCRKPAPGMLRLAARQLGVDLSGAVTVGDQESDLLAGRAAGTATILLRPGCRRHPAADAVVDDLAAAVRVLLAGAELSGAAVGAPPGHPARERASQ